MSELVEFLKARLDEDEAAAKAAGEFDGETWVARGDAVLENVPDGTRGEWIAQRCEDDDTAAHIARHDPARVLADVAAKRAILDGYRMLAWVLGDEDAPGTLKDREFILRGVLKRLATVHARHPDYRQEWKP